MLAKLVAAVGDEHLQYGAFRHVSIKTGRRVSVREINMDLLQILLVTSRDTGRWVIPKGWPSKRLDDAVPALTEWMVDKMK